MKNTNTQTSLIDFATLPVFGEAVAPKQLAQIEGQQQRVESLMADKFWHTLPELQKLLKQKFGQFYSETSISARIRAMRKRGYTVKHERTRAGSNLYQYRAVKADAGLPSAADLDAVVADTATATATGVRIIEGPDAAA